MGELEAISQCNRECGKSMSLAQIISLNAVAPEYISLQIDTIDVGNA